MKSSHYVIYLMLSDILPHLQKTFPVISSNSWHLRGQLLLHVSYPAIIPCPFWAILNPISVIYEIFKYHVSEPSGSKVPCILGHTQKTSVDLVCTPAIRHSQMLLSDCFLFHFLDWNVTLKNIKIHLILFSMCVPTQVHACIYWHVQMGAHGG